MGSVRCLVRAVPREKVGVKMEEKEEEMREEVWEGEKKVATKVYSAVALERSARLKL